MTSIGSYTKQVPLNSGYFRVISALGNPHTQVYQAVGTTASGAISSMSTNLAVSTLTTLSTSLLKDMGAQAVVNGSTFRRLQVVAAQTNGIDGAATAVDSDYLSFWILTGFNGAGAPGGPFVRS